MHYCSTSVGWAFGYHPEFQTEFHSGYFVPICKLLVPYLNHGLGHANELF